MTAQANPIEIDSSWDLDSEDRLDYWAVGHLDPRDFIAALREAEEVTTEPGMVQHRYLKQVPCGVRGDRNFRLLFRDAAARGWQKVTWVDYGDTEEWWGSIERDPPGVTE